MLVRVKAPYADPRPEADLMEVTARFLTLMKTLYVQFAMIFIGLGYFDRTLLQKN